MVAEAEGEVDRAVALLHDGRQRCRRHADPYTWLDVYLLDGLCEVGRRHHHPDTPRWLSKMIDLASRSEMRELTARALMHAAALSGDADMVGARLVAAEIDNPALASRLEPAAPGTPP